MNKPMDTQKPEAKEQYETPILISYSWSCPVHGGHQRGVALAQPPNPSDVIDMNQCKDRFPNDPVYTTKLYGNLKLEVNKIEEKYDV